jgi:hypothetical protein
LALQQALTFGIFCAGVLHIAGFDALSGIAIIACLTVHRLATGRCAPCFSLTNHASLMTKLPQQEFGATYISFIINSMTNQAKVAKTTLPTKTAGMKTPQLSLEQGASLAAPSRADR